MRAVPRPAFVLAAVLAASISGARACSCLDELNPASGKTVPAEKLNQEHYVKAADFVRGKFVTMSASAGERTMAVHGKLQIAESLKGSLAGAVDVHTGYGLGDCGVPGIFLASIAWDRDVEVAVEKLDNIEGGYAIGRCGYAKVLPMPRDRGVSK